MPTESRHVNPVYRVSTRGRVRARLPAAPPPRKGPTVTDPIHDEAEPRRAKGSGVRLAYDTLRDEILALTLPPGALLDEMTLAERFGMSRSPVREALIRLAGRRWTWRSG